MKGRVQPTVVLLSLGLICSTAAAAPPTATEQTITTHLAEAPQLTSLCGFKVLTSSTVYIRSSDFLQPDGTTIRRSHFTVDGDFVRESTGERLLTRARWLETRDFDEATGVISGLRFSVHATGERPVDMTVGHLVVSAPSGTQNPDLITPHMKFPFLDLAAVCTAFS